MYNKKISKRLIDFFIPPKCMFCEGILTDNICETCAIKVKALRLEKQDRAEQPRYTGFKNLDYSIAFYEYNGLVRDAILKAKFKNCASFTREFLQYIPIDLKGFMQENVIDVIISVPSHRSKFYTREFDVTQEMAKKIAKTTNSEYNFSLVLKTKITLKQHNLSREKRKSNLKNAFSVKGEVAGKNILIIDDILTTGNTLDEVARTLKAAGAAKVIGMTFAYDKYEESRR